MKLSWRALFAGSVFLLFPLAHLRPFASVPLYWAEIPLVLLLGGSLLASRVSLWRSWPTLNHWPFMFLTLFLGGSVIGFVANDLPLHSLGALKSFIFLPLVFAWWLATARLELSEYRVILLLWFLGIIASATAGLISANAGFLTYDGRLASLYGSPNHFAMLLSPGVLLSLHAFFQSSRRSSQGGALISLTVIAAALLLTHSYAVLAATVGASAIFLARVVLGQSRLMKSLVFMGVAGFLLWASYEVPTEKFQTLLTGDERSSLASRLMIWEAASKIAADAWPWGIGIGAFQAKYLAYQVFFPPYLEWAVPEPHNLFLSLFLATGILGLLGFIGSIVWALSGLFQSVGHSSETENKSLEWLLLTLFVAVLVSGLVDTPYFKNDLAFAIWGLIGLAWGRRASQSSEIALRD